MKADIFRLERVRLWAGLSVNDIFRQTNRKNGATCCQWEQTSWI